jgi:Phosphotransferase enzyme family
MDLRLDDGTTVTDLSRPPQGTRHRIVFGIEESSGREVAAKIELLPGTLDPERRALEWLDAHDEPAPRLRAVGRVASADDQGALCLVCDRAAGQHPHSLPGWERLGGALAGLSELPWRGSGLDTLDHRAFLAVHEARVEDLGAASGSDLGPRFPALPPSYPASPLVLTHGDPGPGNFLDDGAAGTLIDWEDAYVAPRGLDLGRAAFIALLGAGPEGYAAADNAARSQAVVTGFLAASAGRSPDPDELRWWLTVAGIQFAHRRLERAGEPGVLPWRDAIEVLDRALGDEPAAG